MAAGVGGIGSQCQAASTDPPPSAASTDPPPSRITCWLAPSPSPPTHTHTRTAPSPLPAQLTCEVHDVPRFDEPLVVPHHVRQGAVDGDVPQGQEQHPGAEVHTVWQHAQQQQGHRSAQQLAQKGADAAAAVQASRVASRLTRPTMVSKTHCFLDNPLFFRQPQAVIATARRAARQLRATGSYLLQPGGQPGSYVLPAQTRFHQWWWPCGVDSVLGFWGRNRSWQLGAETDLGSRLRLSACLPSESSPHIFTSETSTCM